MRHKLTNVKKEIVKLSDNNGNTTSNRKQLIEIVETLYTNQVTLQRKVQTRGSEDVPEVFLEEIYIAIKIDEEPSSPGERSCSHDKDRTTSTDGQDPKDL